MRKNLIVGAGFTGAVLAERIASQLGEPVVLIDRRPHIGGNAFDCLNEFGVKIHRYGPHIFHTNSSRIFSYLSMFTEWVHYEHRVLGLVGEQMVPLPFNLTSMEAVFGKIEGYRLNSLLTTEFGTGVKVPILAMRQSKSSEVRRIADFIYENVFLHYTHKQWGLTPEQLDPSVSARVPIHLSRDDRYFQDKFQYMPREGYTRLFERMLDHPLIEVRLGIQFEKLDGHEAFDRVIFTGPIDEYFDYAFGYLPYRSLRFDMRTTQTDQRLQLAAQENYPTPPESHLYTRSTEFPLLTGQSGLKYTTQAFEYPEPYQPGHNEPYYPIPCEENQILYRKYAAASNKLLRVIFAGRLADYNYYNMDQAVGRALSCFEKEIVCRGGGAAA